MRVQAGSCSWPRHPPRASSLKAAELQAPEILGAQQVSDPLHHAAAVNLERVTCALSSPPAWPATDAMELREARGDPKHAALGFGASGALFLFSFWRSSSSLATRAEYGDQVAHPLHRMLSDRSGHKGGFTCAAACHHQSDRYNIGSVGSRRHG